MLRVVEVGLGLLAQFANGLGALLVGTGPDAQRDTVQSVRRILLEHKGMVGAVGLALASANLNIVGEAGLIIQMLVDLSRSNEDALPVWCPFHAIHGGDLFPSLREGYHNECTINCLPS